jgi:hypothetical protein
MMAKSPSPAPLSIEELEIGLVSLGRSDVNLMAFWDENIARFRQTVLLAIRDTSDALLSPKITLAWRIELESQLDALVRYISLADRYIALRSPTADDHLRGSNLH